jgi:hypothetical protein
MVPVRRHANQWHYLCGLEDRPARLYRTRFRAGAFVTFCGNVYDTQSASLDFAQKVATADIIPSYIYDSDANAGLVDTHIYETARQPAVSVFSPNAKNVVSQTVVPQYTPDQIGGLILSIGSPAVSAINVSGGSASDSTNSTVIQMPNGCPLSFTAHGAGGRDSISGVPVANNQTYFIYAIAAPRGGGTAATPSCIASPNLIPSFEKSNFMGSGYFAAATGGVTNTQSIAYNVAPLDAVAVGNVLQSTTSNNLAGDTIFGFTANTGPAGATAVWADGTATIVCSTVCNSSNTLAGMAITDLTKGCIPPNTHIVSATVLSAIQLSQNTNATDSSGAPCTGGAVQDISISGARQLVLHGSSASGTTDAAELDIGIGYYRRIGAVLTDGSGNLVPFTQEDKTFYLAKPVSVSATLSATMAVPVAFAPSLPVGVSVKAFGRCVGGGTMAGGHVLIYSPGQTSIVSPAHGFPTVPGYAVSILAPTTTFPFSAWTGTGGNLQVISDVAGNIECMLDGWEWPRTQ